MVAKKAEVNTKARKTTKEVKKTTTSKSQKVEQKKPEVVKNKLKPRLYISFWQRIVMLTIFFALFVSLCFLFASKTIEREKTTPIKYTDINDLGYKVYLKKNDFYKEEYLDMNRAYVASLIDHIDIDFKYLFEIDDLSTMDFDYRVKANLIIENNNGVSFVNEEYILKNTETRKLDNEVVLNINDSVVIDYDYYNDLVNKFKVTTGVQINSYLNVYLEVHKKTDKNLKYNIDGTDIINLKIPLSERAIEIKLDSGKNAITKYVTPVGSIKFDRVYLTLEIAFFIVSCLILHRIVQHLCRLIKSKSNYDRYVDKLLKNYDRIIVETKTMIDMSDYSIIDINSFQELLDVRDNMRLPIMYTNIVKHEKGLFYIKNGNDIYKLVIKNVDLKK